MTVEQINVRQKLQPFLTDQRRKWMLVQSRNGMQLRRSQPGERGLTIETLAHLTTWSTRMLSKLEKGELSNPNPQLLEAVATALRMSDAEREYFLEVATGRPPAGHANCPKMRSNDRALAKVVDDLYPNPTFVMDAAWQLMVWNDAVPKWICDFAERPVEDRRLPIWMFCDPHAPHVFPHWEQITREMIARIRATHAHLPNDPHLNQFVSDLCKRSPRAQELWESDATVFPWPEIRVMRVPGHTDPEQKNDESYFNTAQMLFFKPVVHGDERLLVSFGVEPDERISPTLTSEQACAACARIRANEAGLGRA